MDVIFISLLIGFLTGFIACFILTRWVIRAIFTELHNVAKMQSKQDKPDDNNDDWWKKGKPYGD